MDTTGLSREEATEAVEKALLAGNIVETVVDKLPQGRLVKGVRGITKVPVKGILKNVPVKNTVPLKGLTKVVSKTGIFKLIPVKNAPVKVVKNTVPVKVKNRVTFFEHVQNPPVKNTVPVKNEGLMLQENPTKLGGALRKDAIPEGSKIEYIGPGKVKFHNVEFKSVRDLKHMEEKDLRRMLKGGKNPIDIHGERLDGHHHQQKYHRDPGNFIVEIPEPQHCISKPNQHPLGTSGGLTKMQREDWNKLRKTFNKERAKNELLNRGLLNDK